MNQYENVQGLPDMGDPNLFGRPDAGDESLFVVFYMGTLQNEGKTIAEGRPIIDDVECVRIIVPGDKNNINDRPATPQDKRRFHKQYGLFKQGMSEDAQITGTRLHDWPLLTRGQAEELRYIGIRTVEQLAEVRDDVTSRVPGLVRLKQHAQVWLGKTKTSAEAAKQAQLMDDQRQRIDTLEQVVRDQADRLEKLLREKAGA
jgi:hypothetical protein